MNNPKISIILPVYNGEKYIDICLESVIKQTYKNWELIIINDGSTDKSEAICKTKAEKDERIKYNVIENGGVSNARNTALSMVNGDFVFFIDADDYLDEKAFEVLVNNQIETNADIVVMSHTYIYEDSDRKVDNHKIQNAELLTNNAVIDNFLLTDKYGWEIWGKLYKKEVVDRVMFNVNRRIAEDAVFLFETLLKANSVSLLTYHGYFYRQNSQSVMAQRISLKNFDAILSVNDIKSMSLEHGYENGRSFELKYYIWFLRQYVKGSNKEINRLYKDKVKNIREVISEYKFSDAKSRLTSKYFIEYLMIKYVYSFYKLFIKLFY